MGADNSCGEKEAIEGKGLLVAAKGIMGFSVQPRYFLEVVRNALVVPQFVTWVDFSFFERNDWQLHSTTTR